jgi:predicted RNA-binding Zn-ribbon protein involved in translation (DUF1610 family)
MKEAYSEREIVNCSKCGTVMEETAKIASFGDDPGLRLFECPDCGSSISRLETAEVKQRLPKASG